MTSKRPYKIEHWQSVENTQWYWHLVSPNGKLICAGGEGFTTKSNCLRSMRLCKKVFSDAIIVLGRSI